MTNRSIIKKTLLFILIAAYSLIIVLPSNATAATCGSSIAPSSTAGNQAVNQAYQTWKERYVTANGAGGNLRVQRSDYDGYDTVLEGIAYGMLFAAYMDDRTVFDKLFAYEQSHLDRNGLMNWRIGAGGNTTGENAATDSDEDIAIALIAAEKRWGGTYGQAARKQIDLVLNKEVESGSNILKPGDEWGGSSVMNPSYISPSYYKVFASYTGNTRWNAVYDANMAVFDNIDRNTPTKTTGLLPDWSASWGAPTNGMSFDYGYDAVRYPLRMAMSANWDCDTKSIARLDTFNNFFASKDITKVVDGYRLDGNPYGGNHHGVALGPIASAATVSSNSSYRSGAWNELVRVNWGGYYPESLRMFSMLIATGKITNPLTLGAGTTPAPTPTPTPTPEPTPTPTPTPTPANSKVNIWWPSNGSAVTGVQPFKAMLEGKDVSEYEMYWQVDNGVLNKMANDYRDYPHKESLVDVSGWNWRGNGPYVLTFVVKNAQGTVIDSKNSSITIQR